MNNSYLNSTKNSTLSSKPSRKIGLFLMVLFVFIMPLVSFGQTNTWQGGSGGTAAQRIDWNRTGNWSLGSLPTATNDVIIPNATYQPTISNAAAVCKNLTIDPSATLTVGANSITVSGATSISGTLLFSSTNGTETFTGLVTVNSGGVWNNIANEAVTFRGGITNNNTFSAGTGIQTFDTNSQSLSGIIAIPSATVTGITLTNNDIFTVSTALAGTGGVTNTATGVLNIGGTSAITTLTATAAGNTVNYNGAAQTAKVTTYSNLILSGGLAKTFANTPTVNGVLSMEGTASITVTTGVVTYGANATLQYNKPGAYTATLEEWPATFSGTGGVIIANTGVITLGAAKAITNNFSIALGSSVNLGSNTHTAGTLTLGGSGTAAGSWGSTTSGATFKNNTYFSATTGIINVGTQSCTTGYWTGVTSIDWNTASNWCSGTVPIATTNVVIPAGVTNMPTIAAGTSALTNNLTLNAGATLTMANAATSLLNIKGDFTNNGTLTAGVASIVTFDGTTTSAIGGTSTSTFGNLVVNKSAAATTVTNSSAAFATTSNLTVTQGNLILTATDANYSVSNNLTVAASGTLTHNVYWDTTVKLLLISGNLDISGGFSYSVRSHIQMNGVNKTIKTGTAALCVLTMTNSSGTISANGSVIINDNFWPSFNTIGGTFATAGNTVTAKGALLVSGGTLSINGGTLNVLGGLYDTYGGFDGIVNLSSGTLNADFMNVGNGAGTDKGTFNQSGGTIANIGNLVINGGTAASNYTCTGSPTINISGTWTNNKTFTAANSTVNFVGTSAQTINGNLSGANGFYNLTFNGVGGSWTNNAPMDVANTLTMSNGILNTTTSTIVNITNTAITGASVGTVTSFVSGPIKWATTLASSYSFPVGKGATYLPFVLKNTAAPTGTPTAQVEAFNANCGGTANLSTIRSLSTSEYWSLATSGSFTNSSVSLTRQTAIAPLDAIAGCATVNGTYGSLAGTANTYGVSSSSAIGTNRFFVLGDTHAISTSAISGSPFCPSSNVSVPFTITGTYTAGNVFTAQLSDASGIFASPVSIGTLTQTTAGTITGTIPSGTVAGTKYRIRVVSSNPNVIGSDNGSDLTVYNTTASISGTTSVCTGDTAPKITFTNPQSYGVTIYYNINGGSTLNVYVGANSYIDWVTAPTGSSGVFNYNLVSVNNGSCSTAITGTATVTVNSRPTVTFTAAPASTSCTATDITYTTQSGMSNYTWVVPGVLNTDYSISSGGIGSSSNTVTLKWLTAGSKTVTVNYTASGCYASSAASNSTTVAGLPTAASISGTTSVCTADTAPKITFTNPQSYAVTIYYNINGGATQSGIYVNANSYVDYVTAPTGTAGVFNYNLVSVSNGSCSTAITGTATVTVNSRPTVTFTAAPASTSCTATDITYTTQSGMSNYLWVVPGVLNTDYSISSGGIGSSSNTVTLKWLTAGSKTVTVNYTASGCYASSAASNTTTANALPTAASISGTTSVCVTGTQPQITISNPQSYAVTVYYNINGGTTQSVYVNGSSSINYIYVGTGTAGVFNYNLVSVSNGSCSSIVTGTATVTVGLTTPIPGTPTQPSCSVTTGSVVLSGLPASGTVLQTGTVVKSYPITGTTMTISGLAAGTYQFAASNGTCTSSATGNVTINSIANVWNGLSWNNGTPSSSQVLTFNGNYPPTPDPNVDISGCSVTVSNGANVIIKEGRNLIITNEVTVSSGSLTFEDTASLVQINNVTNSGNITYKRQAAVRNTDYTYWSTPVSPLKLAGAGGISYSPTNLAGSIFYSYLVTSTTEDWKSETALTLMEAGKGYSIRASGAITINPPSLLGVSFTGVPNNGDYSIPLVNATASYLLGNPYPSAIDANAFLSVNSGVLDGTLYFWTHNTQIGIGVSNPGSGVYAYSQDDYASYNGTGGVAISGGIKPNGKIGAGQGFFATSTTATGNIVFTNRMRMISDAPIDNTQFFRTKNPSGKTKTTNAIEKNRIWLNLTNTEGAFKQTLIGYVTGATNAIDGAYDGESFDGQEFIDFYSINQDKNLTIQGRALPFDENDEVPLGFRSTIEGPFTINIDEVDGSMTNQDVFIEDKLTNTTTNLKTGNYTFNTVAGTFDDRFVLKYKASDKTLGNTDFDAKTNQVVVSIKNKQIKINAFAETIDKVVLFDMTGKEIYQKEKVDSNEFLISNLVFAHQTLIVKTTLQNGKMVTEKIIY